MPAEPAGAAVIGRALIVEGVGEGEEDELLPTCSVSHPSAAAVVPAPERSRPEPEPAPRRSVAPLLLLLVRLRGILVGPGGGIGRLESSGLLLLDF